MEQTPYEQAVQIIARRVLQLIPHASAERTTVTVEHRFEQLGRPACDSWTGDIEGFARRIATDEPGGDALPLSAAAELQQLRDKIAGLEAIVRAATEYRVWNPGRIGLYVRRAVGATGFAVWEARTRRKGRRAWTREGWQFLALLSDEELFCWPDAATAVAEAQRLVNDSLQPEPRCEDAVVDGSEG
ncbi:hypothetical protein OG235_24515 [Streptomyces sp. NBC_00024]|uniref:hypothetical protein n=1 Tax=Streptomyces sp. NBC_00024 TaxID=2903612 RepID=UPI003249A772